MRIALTGNPNSGKTTMYNALTGRSERVGNWAGVTVDKKESPVKPQFNPQGLDLVAVDLPGAYSMSPFTSEESITSSYVRQERPDVIVNIVDATNLSRSLFFTTQLLELGIPVVVALNKHDLNEKKGTNIDVPALSKAFIIKAGTIILVCNAAVHIMQNFNWSLQLVEEGMESTSILATIAHPFAILMIPLGFGVWQLAAAAVTGFIAKENVVGTLAVVYGLTNFIDVDALELVGGANEVAATMGLTTVAALAYLMFNLYTPPCFAAIGAMNSEMHSKKWLFGGIALQLGTGYTLSFLVYQIGTLVTTGSVGTGFVPGLIAVACMVGIVVALILRTQKHMAQEYTLSGAGKGKVTA